MKCGKFALIVIGLGQNLHFSSIALEVDEDERLTCATNGQDTTGEGDGLVLHELIVLRDGFVILASKLVDSVCSGELVRVRVGSSVADSLHERLSIVCVLGRVLLFLVKGVGCGLFLRVILLLFFLLLLLLSLFGILLGLLLVSCSLLLSFLELAKIEK